MRWVWSRLWSFQVQNGPDGVVWYDHGEARNAAEFYASVFPDSDVGAGHEAPSEFPGGAAGDELTVEFSVLGRKLVGLNGGDLFKPNEAVSFMIVTEDQAETDRYWDAIVGSGRRGERLRLVQGPVGLLLADHAARPARRHHEPGQGGGEVGPSTR